MIERETIGGQAGSSSLIRNYLGFQRGVTGADLATRAHQQAWVFGTTFLQMCQTEAIRSDADRLYLTTSSCAEIATGAVVLAMGVSYRRLGIPVPRRTRRTRRLLRGLGLGGGAVHRPDGLRRGGGNSAGRPPSTWRRMQGR